MASKDSPGKWPNGARAAVVLTLDNMGEAADIQRKLWPESESVGQHYTVKETIPSILALLKKYDISVTYFVETWNLDIYGDFIVDQLVANGHEIGWHAWQHEPWAKLNETEERQNFERSFGSSGISKWSEKIESYSGFRPPGGIINDKTLEMCIDHGLQYISPAGEEAAQVKVDCSNGQEQITVLPFKWATVDAYYYMETFAGLRRMKGEYPQEPQGPQVLVARYIAEVDKVIENGTFLSLLFHPFLSTNPERLEALETVLKYLANRRAAGDIWLARCKDIAAFIQDHPTVVGSDPQWDLSSWR
ncbi:hypothetical protein E8E14_000630 [Neopestalotiopsis sp. 37M]|nr:hypothetical protein E8E14_000630 [Neopestalotiopsis sp. 37M]